LIDIDDKIFVEWDKLVVIKRDEGIDGALIHVDDRAEFSLVGIMNTIARETLPGR
jgi:hypothetical protein